MLGKSVVQAGKEQYCSGHPGLLMWRRRRRARREPAPTGTLLPQGAPDTLRIGRYVVGAEGDFLLAGHPGIRY